ncbi:EAL domain-containing protein [Aurantimonas sp. A2-1-M11]|uniref:putative bifunctional diguanylate cyclase/phosphodiesterase n=1 Tax=Aurantimonas sp. A2-1-M11 TaxID=3113712 RepID=UPI002F947989
MATAILGLAAAYMLSASFKYMKDISRSSENNIVYEVMTTSPELARLQAEIASRFVPGTSTTDDDVALRFGIIQNRMKILGTESSRRLRQDSAEATELIDRMQVAIRTVEPTLEHLNTPGDAIAALKVLEPLNTHAARLAALTTSTAATRIAANEAKLAKNFWLLLAEILGLLACGIILIALLRRTRQKARRLARLDVLTGLPNRLRFKTCLEDEFPEAAHGTLAILMLDLDLFKHVNDTLGHAAGDCLLRSVSERLAPVLTDAVLFARLSGDEFAAIYVSRNVETLIQQAAQRVKEALSRPFEISETAISTSASMGLAIKGPDDHEPEDILQNADLALYEVKGTHRGGIRLFQRELKVAYIARQTLTKDLELALENDEFELHFQPVVSLEDNRTVAFEALLRWNHSNRGMVFPGDFIPIAEESGLIVQIGRWVIDQACAVAATWPEEIDIAVNVSARQFFDPHLTSSVLEALHSHALRPGRLTLELTESALIQNDHVVIEILNHLRTVGVKIALDDFGTGYASLGYLTRFPFDLIKIDQTFVRKTFDQEKSQAIVDAICYLSGKLGLNTVAEGIETEAQLAMVRTAGCHFAQGFLFDGPITATQCTTRLTLERLRTFQGDNRATLTNLIEANSQKRADRG